jgi:hypothetical protein
LPFTLSLSKYSEAELTDDLNGAVRIQVKDRVLTFEIEKAKGVGDGTVPLYSGAHMTYKKLVECWK